MTGKKYKDISDYIKSSPKEVRGILKEIRQTIAKAIPKAEEAIKYQIPTFRLNGKNLLHFAAWKKHIGFYPTPSAAFKFKKELEKYEKTKGTIKFPLNKPMPLGLIAKIAKFRAVETLAKIKKVY